MNDTDSRLVRLFLSLTRIDAESFHEGEMAQRLTALLSKLGIRSAMDDSASKTGSDTGNLYSYIPGSQGREQEEPFLFLAHMDTVAPGRGKQAVLHEDGTITSDGQTVLGADDMTAAAAILEALRIIREENRSHRPLEVLFTTAEEAYTVGASAFDFTKIHAREAFAFDCSDRMGSYSETEPTLLSFTITVSGCAAHAGFEPEKGINALQAAARTIAKLPLGRPDDHTTLNIGTLTAGTGTNVVPEKTVLSGEIRSLIHKDALALYERTLQAAREEAERIGAAVEEHHTIHLTAYRIPPEDPALVRYQRVLSKLGVPAYSKVQYGGSDINVVRRHGIDGICIANPMYLAHTTKEYTTVSELQLLERIVQELMLS